MGTHTTISRRWLLNVALIGAIVLGPSNLSGQRPEPPPNVVGGQVPFFSDIALISSHQGDVRQTVSTVGGRVSSVQADGTSAVLFSPLAEANVRTWRISSQPPAKFDVLYQYRQSPAACFERDLNPSVTMRLPTTIEVHAKRPTICDSIGDIDAEPGILAVRRVIGVVMSERDGLPLPGTSIRISRDDSAEFRQREIRTDPTGRFRVSGLVPGRYSLNVGMEGYLTSRYVVLLDPTAATDELQLRLRKSSAPPPPPVLVTGAAIPLYPEAARKAGVEGVVRVRASLDSNGMIDVDADGADQTLARSAADNVRTWLIRAIRGSVLDVVFHYVLTPGDCTGAQGVTVQMNFPYEVTVTAKRVLPCRSFSPQEGWLFAPLMR